MPDSSSRVRAKKKINTSVSNVESSVTLTSTVFEELGELSLTNLEEEELEENEKGGLMRHQEKGSFLRHSDANAIKELVEEDGE